MISRENRKILVPPWTGNRAKVKHYLSFNDRQISDQDINDLESGFFPIPEDYRSLLLRENGGVARLLKGGGLVFYSLADGPNDLRDKWKNWQLRFGGAYFPIADFDDGEYLILDIDNGNIIVRGEIISANLEDYLTKECAPLSYSDPIKDLIINNKEDDLRTLLEDGSIDETYRVSGRYTLPQYATLVRKQRALEIFSEYSFDFSGCLHLLLKSQMADLPIIRVILEGGADLNERDEDGLEIWDLDSPWLEDIRLLEREIRGGGSAGQ